MYDTPCFRSQEGSRNCVLSAHPINEHRPSPPCLNCKELVFYCICGNRVPANPRQNREFWGEEPESDDELLPSLDDYYNYQFPSGDIVMDQVEISQVEMDNTEMDHIEIVQSGLLDMVIDE